MCRQLSRTCTFSGSCRCSTAAPRCPSPVPRRGSCSRRSRCRGRSPTSLRSTAVAVEFVMPDEGPAGDLLRFGLGMAVQCQGSAGHQAPSPASHRAGLLRPLRCRKRRYHSALSLACGAATWRSRHARCRSAWRSRWPTRSCPSGSTPCSRPSARPAPVPHRHRGDVAGDVVGALAVVHPAGHRGCRHQRVGKAAPFSFTYSGGSRVVAVHPAAAGRSGPRGTISQPMSVSGLPLRCTLQRHAGADHRARVVVDAEEIHRRGDGGQVAGSMQPRCVGPQVLPSTSSRGSCP